LILTFFGNYYIEISNVYTISSVFNIDFFVYIEDFNINLNFNVAGGKAPNAGSYILNLSLFASHDAALWHWSRWACQWGVASKLEPWELEGKLKSSHSIVERKASRELPRRLRMM
jgi:hypothetical protein